MAYFQNLQTEIEYLKGIGPVRAEVLKKEINIYRFEDLLNYFPFRYIDKSKLNKIKEIHDTDSFVQLKGKVRAINETGGGRGRRLVAEFYDDTGSVELIWFKGVKWIKQYLSTQKTYLIFGKPTVYKSFYTIAHPEMELFEGNKDQKLQKKFQPVYSTTEKLTSKNLDSKGISKLTRNLLDSVIDQVHEILPEQIVKTFRLLPRQEAYRQIHYPESQEMMTRARNRLKFEELFLAQTEILQIKVIRNRLRRGFVMSRVGDFFNGFYKNVLPFELTEAQKRVIKEIRKDLISGMQMNRLLQGDVGSGKTIVALMAMLLAIDNKCQTCIMAPTEILAQQHFQTISKMVEPLGLEISLLTGTTKKSVRKEIQDGLESGRLNIIVSTHALIEDWVKFNTLGLVVIDEQHRFGVAQRARLWQKGNPVPHVLIMSATPIPRTLAMSFYGDLDVSVIDEMPPGRKPVKTFHFFEQNRLKLTGFLKQKIKEGQQVYIVYPLIEESAKLDYQNLMDGYDNIVRQFPLPEFQTGIVHGKMKASDKELTMQRFKNGDLHILVSTTVIEVGVDVPNASVMVIESAERFGLSQLHQLRGRVGRGADQSFCFLVTGDKISQEAKVRMDTMVKSTDGFKIAEVDLQLRGPGDLTGTRQSGIMEFRLANLATDHKILQNARSAAQKILSEDPDLSKPENRELKRYFNSRKNQGMVWSEIS